MQTLCLVAALAALIEGTLPKYKYDQPGWGDWGPANYGPPKPGNEIPPVSSDALQALIPVDDLVSGSAQL